jgi:hypothetical protein
LSQKAIMEAVLTHNSSCCLECELWLPLPPSIWPQASGKMIGKLLYCAHGLKVQIKQLLDSCLMDISILFMLSFLYLLLVFFIFYWSLYSSIFFICSCSTYKLLFFLSFSEHWTRDIWTYVSWIIVSKIPNKIILLLKKIKDNLFYIHILFQAYDTEIKRSLVCIVARITGSGKDWDWWMLSIN